MSAITRIKMADQTISAEDIEELVRWLRSDPWLTQGPLVKSFEQRWASWLGVEQACFVNSGSSANLLAYACLDASGRLPNRRVVVPAVSWATTVAPAFQLGFEPIICDAEPRTLGLDPGHLARLLEQHRPAIVVLVHVLGVPCEMEPILALKRRFGFLLIEDACAATGSRYDGKLVGSFGDLATFSFFYGHHLSTIEGGMVTTGDRELADLLFMLRSHGWSRDVDPDERGRLAEAEAKVEAAGQLPFNRPFTFHHPGFNLRSTDLNAHLGLSQMNRMEEVLGRRRQNHRTYSDRFAGAPGFHQQTNPRADVCSIAFGLMAASAVHRGRIAAALADNGVETRPLGGGNMSRQPFWRRKYGTTPLAVADDVAARSFQLPNHAGLSAEDLGFICDTVLTTKADPR